MMSHLEGAAHSAYHGYSGTQQNVSSFSTFFLLEALRSLNRADRFCLYFSLSASSFGSSQGRRFLQDG